MSGGWSVTNRPIRKHRLYWLSPSAPLCCGSSGARLQAANTQMIYSRRPGCEFIGCAIPTGQASRSCLGSNGFRPNNVLGGIPTLANDYSPLWDAQLLSRSGTPHATGLGSLSDRVESHLGAPAFLSIARSCNGSSDLETNAPAECFGRQALIRGIKEALC